MKGSHLYVGIVCICFMQACDLNLQEPEVISRCKTYVEAHGKEILRQEMLYDAQNRPIAELFYSAEGKVYRRIAYGYDNNNLIQIRTYQNETLTEEIQQSYIGNRLTYKNVYANEKPVTSTAYTYYATGVIKRTVEDYLFEPDRPITTVTNYDTAGNKMTVFRQIYEDKTKKVISRYEMDQYIRIPHPENQLPSREITLIHFGYYEAADTVSDVRYRYQDTLLTSTIYHKKGMYDLPDSARYEYNDARQLTRQVNFFTKKLPGLTVHADTLEYQYDNSGRLILEFDQSKGVKTLYRYQPNN